MNKVVGVAIDPGTNQDYALEDDECDASYTGLVEFSGSARVPVGASVLLLKSVADMTLTPDGYLLIASGAERCSETRSISRNKPLVSMLCAMKSRTIPPQASATTQANHPTLAVQKKRVDIIYTFLTNSPASEATLANRFPHEVDAMFPI